MYLSIWNLDVVDHTTYDNLYDNVEPERVINGENAELPQPLYKEHEKCRALPDTKSIERFTR